MDVYELVTSINMKKRGLLTLITFLLTLLSSIAVGSDYVKGYIVSLTGDTTHGYIEYAGDFEVKDNVKFKMFLEDEQPKNFFPDNIKQFVLESGGIFEPVEYGHTNKNKRRKHQSYFARYLLSSDYNLYKLQLSSSSRIDYVYIILKDSTYYTISSEKDIQGRFTGYVSSKSLGTLIYLLSSCPDGRPDTITSVEFNDDKLVTLLSQYSRCNIVSYPVGVYKDTKRVQLRLLAELGYGIFYGGYDELMGKFISGFNVLNGFWGGIYCEIITPSVSKNFSVRLGLNCLYAKNNFDDAWFFKIPVAFNYSFYRKNQHALDVSAGLNLIKVDDFLHSCIILGMSYRMANLKFSIGFETPIFPIYDLKDRYIYGGIGVGYYFW
jgi:hypothetical protein